ncbi:MAG: glutamate synthase large subunit [Clostridiales bacterium]|nr:glutamate synthase large subunit [Clostridiales bacterium]
MERKIDNYRVWDAYPKSGLYDPSEEHENCGIGAVIRIDGTPSAKVTDDALKIVETLEHRAGKDASGKTGDGVGILMQISHEFFKTHAAEAGINVGDRRSYGIGMFFFPQSEDKKAEAQKVFEKCCEKEGMEFLGWRQVPVDADVLGERARECMPNIYQGFVARPDSAAEDIDFDRMLYFARSLFEKENNDTYVCSCSCRTIVYKGMFLVAQLRTFYKDLAEGTYSTAFGIVHSRFSTNTNPTWQRSHPYRMLVHNGEINTITGNMNKMLSRENIFRSKYFEGRYDDIYPMMDVTGSDSARLDNTIEFMTMAGVPLPLAIMITIPEPWQYSDTMSREKRAFYQYYATMMEPWDGPASIIFTDGDTVGATLDRNGLRPSRYYITNDGYLILSSEVGALTDIDEANIIRKDRLHPGKILIVDTVKGEVIDDSHIKNEYITSQPYGEWLDHMLVELKDLKINNKRPISIKDEDLYKLQRAFGYSYGNLNNEIIPMCLNGVEPTAAMGVDAPVPPLSDQMPPLFDYFKQRFAQVTNPPLDSTRESVITDTTVYLGITGNILEDQEENCRVLKIHNPILTNLDMMKIRDSKLEHLRTADISMLYTRNESLKDALDALFRQADEAHEAGATILILTDRGVDEAHLAIPSLLAVAALETYLVRTRMNTAISIIVETGEPTEVHHFATLLGFGASAINPYLALDTIGDLIDRAMIDKEYTQACDTYISALVGGIVKIAAKMGISTLQSYQGAKVFEALGIGQELMDFCFPDTVSRVGGIGLSQIEDRTRRLHEKAFDPYDDGHINTLAVKGWHKSRSDKERHLYDPQTIHMLQVATQTGDYEKFKEFTSLIDSDERSVTLRSLLELDVDESRKIPLDEVESVESIMRRFKTGAMSYGSISQEAHECMAIAMNRIGGKSNSGEGGEDHERMATKGQEENRNSAIKQVASGRFGVTSEYLTSADELQIKMAQGAKPGEGGHLPAGKVYPHIAKTRHSTPGVSLISPPPHHDIYSIEDLAQLIYDLKNANRNARISVKLVSESGVGTIASGVAKAGARVILISGYDGGTGAAPASSIHDAGMPWEIGLAETHRTLIQNGLRSKVRLETDGKLLTGKDVAIACMLGAEEFGFATAPLVTMGCIMMRVCNLDTCPVGVATQNPKLRAKFRGKPEYVVNFMTFIASQLREIMADLGIRTVDELVGRSDLLKLREGGKKDRVDLSDILDNPYAGSSDVKCRFDEEDAYDFGLEKTKDMKVIMPAMQEAFDKGEPCKVSIEVSNLDRTLGTLFGSEITRKFGQSLADDHYQVECKGAGGQSFGAFIPKGLTMNLEGDANDYFGKGLSGGILSVTPPSECTFKAEENIIIGNVALFGATSGKAFINGLAGERFCVRNSGAEVVVEGVGDHGCEYMTGGVAVILGSVGKNFAAGMSGGVAYVLDMDNSLYTKLNKSLVGFERIRNEEDRAKLVSLIEEHVRRTGSSVGQEILDNIDEYVTHFKKVIPHDYKRMIDSIVRYKAEGMSDEDARIAAFRETTQAAD